MEEVPAIVNTGDKAWAQEALQCIQQLLEDSIFAEFRLYSLHVKPSGQSLDVRLDKLTDKYGSPTLDDMTRFSRALSPLLEKRLGAEVADSIRFDISSPGGLRALAVPRELERFRSVPLEVEFAPSPGARRVRLAAQYLGLASEDSHTRWQLLDLPANWRAMGKKKGQRLSKKELTDELVIPQPDIRAVRFYFDLDF